MPDQIGPRSKRLNSPRRMATARWPQAALTRCHRDQLGSAAGSDNETALNSNVENSLLSTQPENDTPHVGWSARQRPVFRSSPATFGLLEPRFQLSHGRRCLGDATQASLTVQFGVDLRVRRTGTKGRSRAAP